ncbi:class I SAM-dependent methyltransferase [Phenylobacterium deserti]|uniref:Class I SAM-dependent methyltransferase n=1 Tax=Phenylobacterium deserti TaxID=1914756 RepID=A0A328AS50_9CAUL|nr:class I SAM-dependent methyltransferase [Phenylobacterium deserti]RAK57145.1 hypothetical protein DJ018_04095 [Phenylobacterium deserti]
MEQIWLSEDHGTLRGVPFRFHNGNYENLRTTADEIVVLKRRFFMENYRALAAHGPVRRMLEVGVFQGGSSLLFADMFPEAKIVGIDWNQGNPEIQAHLERMGYADRVKLYWGVSQDDRARIEGILRAEFEGEPLDWVVDDCSHLYSYTTKSFDVVYPHIRRGGFYALEDWGCVHKLGRALPAYFFETEQKPLSAMVLELAMAAVCYPQSCELSLTFQQAFVRKLNDLPPFEQLARPQSGAFDWVGFRPATS